MTFKKHLITHQFTIKEALEKLNLLGRDAILFVVDENECLFGSLTDGDVRRGLLKGYSIEKKVVDIIQPHPKYIRKGDADINKIIKYREQNYKIIPILDKDSDRIINVVNFRKLKSYLPIDAIVMAGGKGQRLRPLTETTPKPLLEVGDKAIIDHNVDRLIGYGIDDFWITLNYLGDQIETHFEKRNISGVDINFIQETKPLGTIGSLSNIEGLKHDHILLTNSDLLTNVDYESFYLDFLNAEADFSVLSIPYKVEIPYAILEQDEKRVLGFQEKPTHTYWSNGGIYLMKKELLDLIPKDAFYNATDLMDQLISLNRKIITYHHNGYWLDIGRIEEFNKAQEDINRVQF